MEQQGLNTIICFNKADLENGDGPSSARLAEIYSKAGYETLVVSATEDESIDKVLANAEIKTMINAFGCGFSEGYGNDFDIRREVFSAMARINAPILEMKSGNESLEDMFLKLTQGAGKAGR